MSLQKGNIAINNQEAEANKQDIHPELSENSGLSSTAQADDSAYARSRCGGVIRKTREKLGLTVQDVASHLKISSRQIESIEADHFVDLPEPTIVRGFIRNYAKLLKIDAVPLLDAYSVLVPPKEPLAFAIKPTSSMKVSNYKKNKSGRFVWVGLFIILMLGVWFFYQSYVEKPSPTLSTAETTEPLPVPALPAAERGEQAIDLPLPALESSMALPPSSTVEANTTAVDSVSAPTTGIADIPTSTETKPVESYTGLAKLEINAHQETWISIVDTNDKELYNKTIFAGSRETINAKPPFSLVVGNASGVSISLNDKPLNLGPHTRSNVARVKLDKSELSQFE